MTIPLIEAPINLYETVDRMNELIDKLNAAFDTELDATLAEGAMYVGDANNLPVGVVQPKFTAFLAAQQNADGDYKILYDTEEYDIGNSFDISTSIFTAPSDGIYHFFATARLDPGALNVDNIIYFKKNGTEIRRMGFTNTGDGLGDDDLNYAQISTDVQLVAGDTIEVWINEVSGQVLFVFGGANHTYFSGHKVG